MASRRNLPDLVLAVIPGMTLLALTVMQESFALWRHEWEWSWAQWGAQVQLTGPMTAGLAAWLVHDVLRRGRGDWLATTPRGSAFLRRLVLVAAIPAATAAVLTGIAVSVLAGSGGALSWPVQTAVSMAAAILGCSALGAVAARHVSRAVVAPLMTVLTWALVVGLVPIGTSWLRVGGAGHTLVGYRVHESLVGHRVLATLVIVVAAVVLLTATTPRTWGAIHRVGAMAAVIGAVGTLVFTGWFRADVYDVEPDPAAGATSCDSRDDLTVCSLPAHEDVAAQARPVISRILQAREDLGLAAPSVATETTPSDLASGDGRTGQTSQSLFFTLDPSTGIPESQMATSLVVPNGCFRADEGLPPTQFDIATQAVEVLTLWATRTAGASDVLPPDIPSWTRFEALSPSQQRVWLRSALQAADECTYDTFPAIA